MDCSVFWLRMSYSLRLSQPWRVCATELDAQTAHFHAAQSFLIPECSHLQPVLYPDNPYWGQHIRAVNDNGWMYEHVFRAPEVPYHRARLRFEAVDYFAAVWLNGVFLGHHEGSFNPFTFDVTHILNAHADNRLLVHVSSPWDVPNPHGNYPIDHVIRGLIKGLYEHGEGVVPPDVNPVGIWRPVWLVLDDGMSVESLRIQAGMDGIVQVTGSISSSVDWDGELTLAIAGDNHEGQGVTEQVALTVAPSTQLFEHSLFVANPALWWSWDHGLPNLYNLTLRLGSHEHQAIFGFRSVRLERRADRFIYWLNDRPVYVRGASYIPGVFLSQHDRVRLAHDVTLARQANLNLLRVHVHVSPPELYDVCNRTGMLVWQDFELNWVQANTSEFEARARALQQAMITQLANHPCIITWSCHNEPTMIFTRRDNLEGSPDPALYADASAADATRSVFICSGQMEHDWQRAGDVHTYYGAIWSQRYTDVYSHRPRLNTEFGFEAPAALTTLQQYPVVWERQQHLEPDVAALWNYQAVLIQFHVEHFRRLRSDCNAGYIHFWLVDLVPQVGCGVLDSARLPKGGYAALQLASQPLHVAMEHDGQRAYALWVFNDTSQSYPRATVGWQVYDEAEMLLHQGRCSLDIAANASQLVIPIDWRAGTLIKLVIEDDQGEVLAGNLYRHPFTPASRPAGYPWKFDPVLGTKVFNRPDAPSLANQSINPVLKLIPLGLREMLAEWAMRQRLPVWFVSWIAKIGDWLLQR